jgi:hypothetical protein
LAKPWLALSRGFVYNPDGARSYGLVFAMSNSRALSLSALSLCLLASATPAAALLAGEQYGLMRGPAEASFTASGIVAGRLAEPDCVDLPFCFTQEDGSAPLLIAGGKSVRSKFALGEIRDLLRPRPPVGLDAPFSNHELMRKWERTRRTEPHPAPKLKDLQQSRMGVVSTMELESLISETKAQVAISKSGDGYNMIDVRGLQKEARVFASPVSLHEYLDSISDQDLLAFGQSISSGEQDAILLTNSTRARLKRSKTGVVSTFISRGAVPAADGFRPMEMRRFANGRDLGQLTIFGEDEPFLRRVLTTPVRQLGIRYSRPTLMESQNIGGVLRGFIYYVMTFVTVAGDLIHVVLNIYYSPNSGNQNTVEKIDAAFQKILSREDLSFLPSVVADKLVTLRDELHRQFQADPNFGVAFQSTDSDIVFLENFRSDPGYLHNVNPQFN